MNTAVSGGLRSLGRLLGALGHFGHGLWVVSRRFRQMDAPARAQAVQWWSRKMLAVIGVQLHASGSLPAGARLLVANHVSWLDILVVHSLCPQARFVSKADVRHWPVLGRMIEGAGTLFIERERKRDALRVMHQMAESLRDGEVVAVFPEGTTSAGHDLLPFHANLFQAAISAQVPVQPLVLRFAQPGLPVSPATAYIGDTTLLQSVWWVLRAQGLSAHICVLPEQPPGEQDRRLLSEAVRGEIARQLAADVAADGAAGAAVASSAG